jgi:hypothetical protein
MPKPSPLFAALERLAESNARAPAALGGGGGSAAPPPIPAPVQPVPLPDPQDPAILAERRRQLLRAAGRSGRASTTLSAQEDYSTDTTGVA